MILTRRKDMNLAFWGTLWPLHVGSFEIEFTMKNGVLHWKRPSIHRQTANIQTKISFYIHELQARGRLVNDTSKIISMNESSRLESHVLISQLTPLESTRNIWSGPTVYDADSSDGVFSSSVLVTLSSS